MKRNIYQSRDSGVIIWPTDFFRRDGLREGIVNILILVGAISAGTNIGLAVYLIFH